MPDDGIIGTFGKRGRCYILTTEMVSVHFSRARIPFPAGVK
jgi:hypothetical protein